MGQIDIVQSIYIFIINIEKIGLFLRGEFMIFKDFFNLKNFRGKIIMTIKLL